MPQKVTPAPAKRRQRPRSALSAVVADLKAGKSIGPIWPKWKDVVEDDARDRAFFLDELDVHSEEYDRLSSHQKSAMRERWAKKHLEKLQQPNAAPKAEEQKQPRYRRSKAGQRRVFVESILKVKNWTKQELASDAKVDWHTVDSFMKGANTRKYNREKLATALGVDYLPD